MVLNVDYFDVTIEHFPNGMDGEQFFNFIHQNFGMFDDGCNSEFNFLDPMDQESWSSGSPEGTIFSIGIPGNNGSVITSQYDNSPNSCFCWTFTTIFDDENGSHPVSGNRQFGLVQNEDGTWSFYIRGVDRTSSSFLINSLNPADNSQVLSTELESAIGFNMADLLWNCIIQNIFNYVNDPLNGGVATDMSSENIRPDLREDVDLRNRLLNLDVSDVLECIISKN